MVDRSHVDGQSGRQAGEECEQSLSVRLTRGIEAQHKQSVYRPLRVPSSAPHFGCCFGRTQAPSFYLSFRGLSLPEESGFFLERAQKQFPRFARNDRAKLNARCSGIHAAEEAAEMTRKGDEENADDFDGQASAIRDRCGVATTAEVQPPGDDDEDYRGAGAEQMVKQQPLEPLSFELPLPGSEAGGDGRDGEERGNRQVDVRGLAPLWFLEPQRERVEADRGQIQSDREVNQHNVLRVFGKNNAAPVEGAHGSLLLHDDFCGHLGMDGAEVVVGAGRGEKERKRGVGIEYFGFEGGFVIADDGVRNVIAIGPLDGGAGRDRQRGGREAEVIDFYFLDFRGRSGWGRWPRIRLCLCGGQNQGNTCQ